MNNQTGDHHIRVLIADDDEKILKCYQDAFCGPSETGLMKTLDSLDAELFDDVVDHTNDTPIFDVVACSQGDDAVSLATKASHDGDPFDVVILDVRMPPGIDGVAAGSAIRAMDSDVEIVIVSVRYDGIERVVTT